VSDDTPRFDLLRPVDDPQEHERRHRPDVARLLAARRLPSPVSDHRAAAPHYKPNHDLITAVNMALAVGAPLLVTGEPGTGKTQVAYHLGWYFGIEVFDYVVRSDSTAEDIKYDFDAVAYLRTAQDPNAPPCRDPDDTERPCTRNDFLTPRPLWQAFEHSDDCVLLIDEIDKAPRDFPNDLLQELDKHEFAHPFDPGETISANRDRPPLVIITSNAERRLPDAFLRRCIWHHIDLDEDLIRRALNARRKSDFPRLKEGVEDIAVKRFFELRDQEAVRKKPTTAEILAWLAILSARGTTERDVRKEPLWNLPAIAALIKDPDDRKALKDLTGEW
jgi:MoxR-like ATPase